MEDNEIVKQFIIGLIGGLALTLFLIALYLILKNTGHIDIWQRIERLFKYT